VSAALVQALEHALAVGDTLVIVRADGAIAEVEGGPLRRGEEWLTLGHEPGSHVHLKLTELQGLRYRETPGRNAALDVLDRNGRVMASIAFRKTNPDRPEAFDPSRLASIRASLGHLAGATA